MGRRAQCGSAHTALRGTHNAEALRKADHEKGEKQETPMHPGAQRGGRQARHIDHLAVRWAAQSCWSYTRSHVLRFRWSGGR
jgi:hypothetical protein